MDIIGVFAGRLRVSMGRGMEGSKEMVEGWMRVTGADGITKIS